MAIELDRADGVARITLDFPERRNALGPEDWNSLHDILDEIATNSGDRAVIITGADPAFCSGAYLTAEAPKEPPIQLMWRINRTALKLHELPQPVVAAVNGVAFGAGFSLALGSDIIVASTTARFCQVFIKRGLAPDFGSSWLLPRFVGLHAAKRIALLGDVIDAAEADRLGLVSQVVAPEELTAVAEDLARRLAEGPPIALGFTKKLLNGAFESSFANALEGEAAASATNSSLQDVAEGFKAFAEKRTPVFRGR